MIPGLLSERGVIYIITHRSIPHGMFPKRGMMMIYTDGAKNIKSGCFGVGGG